MLEFWPDYLFDTTIYSTLKTCQPCINRRIGMDQFGSRWSVFPRVSFLNNQSWHPSGIDILKLWSRIIGMLGKPLVRIFPDQAAPLYIHCLGGSANSDIYIYMQVPVVPYPVLIDQGFAASRSIPHNKDAKTHLRIYRTGPYTTCNYYVTNPGTLNAINI